MNMRIAVIGVGGVGGYFGGLLAAAGVDVVFVARGAHLKALQENGLSIESSVRPLSGVKVRASDDAASLGGPVDLVLVAVKLWDTDAALAAARPLVGEHTAIVSLQNGIEAVGKVSAAYGAARTLGGVAMIAAIIDRPGVIKHTGSLARLQLGEVQPGQNPMLGQCLSDFAAIAKTAGVDLVVPADIQRAIWEKYVFLASFSGITALTRSAIGPILAEPQTRALYLAALEEACAVARAQGVALAADHAAKTLAATEKMPAGTKSSMLGDLERGNRLELPWLSGTVARLGGELGVPAPTHGFITAALQLSANGRG
ncbi:2-dehydropantoate 2-reductase [Ferrovibrio sp.]|uniref:ketopantoate reductase family protein n=1 Tax=Ferrovibrio sp. TaxID=1917215 RepID=UPI0025BE575A|nr:2-dehydropantoate 2-reductase [Ferrovibrio sp.]